MCYFKEFPEDLSSKYINIAHKHPLPEGTKASIAQLESLYYRKWLAWLSSICTARITVIGVQ